MEEIVPTVSVRQLISVYESGLPSGFQRPRARSLGNVLGNNVTVRSHNYHTLSDIQDALEEVEQNLSKYQIYNKRKHVEFQEALFTLLTSVINIEAETDDDPTRKKQLISQTQKLVSILNQKLPNSSTTSSFPTQNQTDYQVKTEEKKDIATKSNSQSLEQKELVENEYSVSVRSLKQNFQSTAVLTLKSSEKQESIKQFKESNLQRIESKHQVDLSSTSDEVDVASTTPEQQESERIEESISVSKLRGIFERKEKENRTGLELIIKPKTFQYQVHIPYTEESLGKYRFFRANSGQYMNEVGILNRVNVSKAKSTLELNSYTYKSYEESQEEEQRHSLEETYATSDVSSEISDCESLDSVKEMKIDELDISEGESKTSLLRSISVKDTIEVFENISKEEDVHVQNSISSDISKHMIILNDQNDDGEAHVFQNGTLNGSQEVIENTEEIQEMTSMSQTVINMATPNEEENELNSWSSA